ncbi:hypothetical protein SAMN06272781_1698 [Streptomyces sp. 1222.2]|uniref:Uncharacterized protein n=1 Tax=Streptomyces stelliscabiei TaxID=146820 RepID=A0A8I0P7Z0_9ACTN|nr:hypothetical protein [Streptomyces stelliscabiei]SOD68652.1 hypothetical protein SAMN06272781_1698 [Streptomyces sp. 1222.2]
MNVLLTAAAFVVLIAAGAYVIHRLNIQHADRIAARRYSAAPPGRRSRGRPRPAVGTDRSGSSVGGERTDRHDGSRGRLPPGRNRTARPR